jgi:hypothetical protein
MQGFTEPASDKLLPDLHPAEQHVFTLVLDLNETIIYSDWKVRPLLELCIVKHVLRFCSITLDLVCMIILQSFDISVLVSKLRWDIPYAILVSVCSVYKIIHACSLIFTFICTQAFYPVKL